jgi:hypothetical protein
VEESNTCQGVLFGVVVDLKPVLAESQGVYLEDAHVQAFLGILLLVLRELGVPFLFGEFSLLVRFDVCLGEN